VCTAAPASRPDADVRERLQGGRAVAGAPRRAQAEAAAQRAGAHEVMAADHDVLEHGQRREDAEVLEAARDPDPAS
jgi:hypothetical protein